MNADYLAVFQAHIMLYTLNFYSALCPLYLSKTEWRGWGMKEQRDCSESKPLAWLSVLPQVAWPNFYHLCCHPSLNNVLRLHPSVLVCSTPMLLCLYIPFLESSSCIKVWRNLLVFRLSVNVNFSDLADWVLAPLCFLVPWLFLHHSLFQVIL